MGSMSAVNAIGLSPNLNIIPINPSIRSRPAISLSFRQTSLYFFAALQTRLTLPRLFVFRNGWCDKNHFYQKYLSIRTHPISLRILFLHLYLLTVVANSSGLGPFGIFAPVGKADPRLSCSFSVGLDLVHSTAFPLRAARL